MDSTEIIERLDALRVGEATVAGVVLQMNAENRASSGFDHLTYALVRFAGMVAAGAPAASYALAMDVLEESGVTSEQLAGVLITLAPVVGAARVVEAAQNLAVVLAAGD
ncbi:MAG: hypothetical protein MUF83_21325 [Acidimicrobiales bacterium]|jgi:hypothetical protein|nr:hypothetical protein [Acidimicrobiales bacterium]